MTGCVSTIFLQNINSTGIHCGSCLCQQSERFTFDVAVIFRTIRGGALGRDEGSREGEREKEGVKEETESHREGRDKRAANDKQRARDKPLEGRMKASGASEEDEVAP